MTANAAKRTVEREKAIPPAKLAHFVLRTPNFDAMRDWYQSVLGAKSVFKNDLLCFMTYDDEHHRVALINTPDAPSGNAIAAGVDHIAFTFEDLGGLLGTFTRLKSENIEPYWCINHGPTTSLYYRDPDGNQIELQVDNFTTSEEVNKFVRSSTFLENPIGVEFNPQRLLERYENGDPIESLVVQGAAREETT
ncbi:MAG: catechol-2,3-dioxygenase [Candidatus Azotimanducaceae bacterium]|jgi:catechol-2,3-dioxygenase